jgi:hypothetical protein
MQQTEHEDEQPLVVLTDRHSHPLQPVALPQLDESDDPEQIFVRAVAEIDTQPLTLPKKQVNLFWQNVLEILVCLGMVGSLIGLVYQVITYPHTLVILYAKEYPASITATLDVPTRTLAPVTVTYSHSTPTTGHGHQDARAASGILTFYNGNASQQTIARGTVITGSDGVQVRTDQAVTLPPANPPSFGQATLTATMLQTGSKGNIHAFDINGTVSGSVFVKNLSAFTGGRDGRDYKAAAQQDLTALTSTLTTTLTQAFTNAFPLRQGEQDIPTQCHTTTSANHQIGQEAQSVTLTASKTCLAVAYHQDELTRKATTAFTQTKPAANYHIAGSVQTTIQSVSPLTLTINGKWVYTFSQDYEQLLAQQIARDTPAQARKVLLRTGVISYASIPNTLPPEAMYINFVVLVG